MLLKEGFSGIKVSKIVSTSIPLKISKKRKMNTIVKN
tara:strand:+ start:3833 stop:3943 length:111 start_codon:yes stop_codon:yes gene_type:complete